MISRVLYCSVGSSRVQRKMFSMASVEARVEKIDEYDLAWTASMNTMLDRTASSCSVRESGISDSAPMVPWMVSNSVRPAKTFMETSRSSLVMLAQDCRSLESGTFSGNQKLVVRRFQTSRSFSSSMWFQLMASYVGMRCATSSGVMQLSFYGLKILGSGGDMTKCAA